MLRACRQLVGEAKAFCGTGGTGGVADGAHGRA